ncbi:MAG: GGDEF domain-containing protein [Aquabacterium sp.]|nr:MAG: GGDEF domain-containing protein [Aquabacterium sp.]
MNLRTAMQPEPDAGLPVEVLNDGFRWMRFSGGLEQRFLADGAARRLRYVTISGALSLLVFLGFLPVDWMMAGDVFPMALTLRLGVFTPVAVLLLLIPFLARDWVLRHIPPLVIEAIVLISGVCAAACLAFILSSSQSPTRQYYHVGLMVVVMYGNMVQRLRFWYAVAFSLAVYAIHLGAMLMVPAHDERLVLPLAALLAASVIFTLAANWALERDERRRYLLSLRRRALLDELGSVNRQLQTLARVDALTGLYNRRHFEEYLERAWQRAHRDGTALAVLMLDVDHFKAYNDRYGHPEGDRCLAAVAEAVSACLRRPGDLVARYGGEEMVAVLPLAGAEEALQAAERIRRAVEALQIPHAGSAASRVVTICVGVASVRADGLAAATDLVELADAALYRAKQAGRNRVAGGGFDATPPG